MQYVPIISLVIALFALTVAFWNFRLSRFPHVRVLTSVYYQDTREQVADYYFEVLVTSWGLPIYDLKVHLIGLFEGHDGKATRFSVQLTPEGTLPNPVAPGQVVKFRVSQTRVREWSPQERANTGFSDLPLNKVELVINGSGGLPIKKIHSKHFPRFFNMFDTRNGKPTLRKATRRDRNSYRETLRRHPDLAREERAERIERWRKQLVASVPMLYGIAEQITKRVQKDRRRTASNKKGCPQVTVKTKSQNKSPS